ncbi:MULTISPECIES: type 4 pilus major pilin [Stenotrophomonas]|uniref:type 4 pilus major pilin n=1 Tax=Stenotrophomonas TaxID=40323 RepID=UPI0021CA471D|nr:MULTISPECIES: type II secretion system protein [Stenotrophomonas]MCU1136913.1 prepilin-type N-terminal cleavage/methylation domain-containing protein [Stenotrophomonas maltophilia]
MKFTTRIQPRISSRKKQKGVTLIELAIALAIIGALVFAIFYMVGVVQNKRITSTESQYLNMMSADLRTKFSAQASFAGLNAANLISMNIAPRPMVVGTTLRSGFSTAVTVAPANVNGVADDGFQFTYQVPSDNCADFVTASEGAFSRVSIAGTVVKNVASGDNQISVTDLANCNASATSNANVTLLFAQGR